MSRYLRIGVGHASSGKMPVLVTGGDYTGPLAAVRALRVAGHEPWVAASGPKAYAARSRAAAGVILLPDSRADPEAFIEGLSAADEEHRFVAILDGTESDLIAIARERDRLGPRAATPPNLEAVLRITSKKTVNELAAHAGLAIPPTSEIDRADLGRYDGLATPLVLKPLRSELHTSDGGFKHGEVHRVSSQEELRRLVRGLAGERWLVQPCIEGRLGAICGVAWNGEVACAVHQIAERIWPADIGVSSYARTVAPDAELEAGVARLIGALGWSGIFQAQFIHAADGPYLIDLNPRIYGSLALATAAGANLPAIWLSLLTGGQVEVSNYRVGVSYRAEELDLRALLHLLRIGKSAPALLGLLPRRHTAHAVATLADPLPMLASFSKLRARLRSRSGT